jgi:hypothetical protein
VEDLDGRRLRTYFYQFLNQVVGDAVIVRVESDVIVDVDPGAGPFAQVETLRRERTQRRLIHRRKLRCSGALALAERSLVDSVAKQSLLNKLLANRG